MSYDLTLDIDVLLAPISEALPCGESRENSSSVELSRAFAVVSGEWHAAKAQEKKWSNNQLLFEGRDASVTHAAWQPIAEKAMEYLQRYSKDARILCSLIESMTRLNGFSGLQQSLSLLRQLLERYPTALNPRPQTPDGPEPAEEFAPFDSISSNLISNVFLEGIQQASVSSSSEFRFVSFYNYELAKFFDEANLDEKVKEQLLTEGQLTQDRFNQSFRRIPKEDLQQTQKDIGGSLEEAKKINALILKLRPENAPADISISNTVTLLERIEAWFLQLAASKLSENKVVAGDQKGGSGGTSAASQGVAISGNGVAILEGQLQNREQAFEQLLKVAEYFRKTEPHSPISYSLEQAVRWGRMPLPQFLEEVLQNGDALSEVYRRIGYRPKNTSE